MPVDFKDNRGSVAYQAGKMAVMFLGVILLLQGAHGTVAQTLDNGLGKMHLFFWH
jgi:hypothetical protein